MAKDRDPNEVGYPDPVGARIRERRLELGLSFAELAKKAGLRSPSYLHYIEKGLKIPSEEIARRLARALDDDEEIYVAWTRVRQRGDVATTMGASLFLQQKIGLPEDPGSGAAAGRGEAPPAFKSVAARQYIVGSRKAGILKMLAAKLGITASEIAAVARASESESPGPSFLFKIPVLPEGSDPDQDPEPIEVLRLDPRLLPLQGTLVGPFAYRLTQTGASRAPERLQAGDLAIITRTAWPLQPDEVYAVRIGERLVLSRARWSEGQLWAVPGAGDRTVESLGGGLPPRALVGRVAVVVRAAGAPAEHP